MSDGGDPLLGGMGSPQATEGQVDDPLDWLGSDPLGSFRFMAMVDWADRVAALPTPIPTRPILADTTDAGSNRDLHAIPPSTSGYAWSAGWAEAVIACESNGRAHAISPYGDYGLMQISCQWHQDKIMAVAGTTDCETLLIPEVNLAVADIIYRDQGGAPWPNCP